MAFVVNEIHARRFPFCCSVRVKVDDQPEFHGDDDDDVVCLKPTLLMHEDILHSFL